MMKDNRVDQIGPVGLSRPSRRSLGRSLCLCCVAVVLAAPTAQAEVLVNESFESVTSGGTDLTGQDGWTTLFDRSGIVVTGTGINTTKVVDTPVSPTVPNNTGNKRQYANFALTSAQTLVLEYDMWADAVTGRTNVFVGVGPSATQPGYIGSTGNTPGGGFVIRAEGLGAHTFVKDAANNNMDPVADNWYRIHSEINLATGQATLFVRDLTGNDPDITDVGYQQLFFNSARTQATASYGVANLAGWDSVSLRLGGGTGSNLQGWGTLDNVQVRAASVIGLYTLGVAGLDLTSSDTDSDSAANPLVVGAGIGTSTSANGNPARSLFLNGSTLTSVTQANAVAANDYVSFSITPNAFKELSFDSLSFDYQREAATAPGNYSIFYDEDPGAGGNNFATLLATGSFSSIVGPSDGVGTNFFRYVTDLSQITALQDLTTTATFRIYFWGASSINTSAARIDNIIVYATTVAIPAPPALAGGLAILPLAMCRRRRRA